MTAAQHTPKVIEDLKVALADRRHFAPNRMAENELLDVIVVVREMLEALRAEEEWRTREAAGAIDPGWDYETMVGAKRRAAIAKAEGGAS